MNCCDNVTVGSLIYLMVLLFLALNETVALLRIVTIVQEVNKKQRNNV